MRNRTVLLVLAAMSILVAHGLASAQETKDSPKPLGRQFSAYHLELSINELADGKNINSRHYSVNVATQNGSGSQQLKIGSRVAVSPEAGKLDYIEVGTTITVRMGPSFMDLGSPGWGPNTISVEAAINSFAKPEQAESGHPVIREVLLSGTSPIVLDKPTVIASADDPDSKHEFQLTVTATKLTP